MKLYSSISILVLFLGGCAHEVGSPDFYAAETEAKFGAAVRQNIAAQTVNPGGATGALVASGARTAEAQKRYEEDDVEPPSNASTLRSGSAGGGGSGGSNN